MKITADQLSQYELDGFLVLEHFVNELACDDLRKRAEKLVSEFDPHGAFSIFSTKQRNRLRDQYFLESGDKIRFFFEEDAFLPDGNLRKGKDQSINKIGHALHDLDPVFYSFSRTPELRQLVAQLGIATPLLLQSMYIFKQPEIGGEVACHQDSTFVYTEPDSVVGLWFALEDATIENGCLWTIPGAHKLGLKARWIRSNQGMRFTIFDGNPWPEEKLVPLEVSKGALVILNGLVPHKSFANRSKKSRHAYSLHVMNGDSHYPEDNWLQRPSDLPLRGF